MQGEDFSIQVNGTTAQLTLLGERVPGPDESLDFAYVSEISRPTEQRGACGPMVQTSTDTTP